jgi:GNAT superfamily N-acetyltransferase
MIHVRRAVAGDVAALLPLCRQFHAESPVHSQLAFDDAKVERLIRNAIDELDWLAAVACDDEGAIVGMLLLYCLEGFFTREREVGDLTFWVAPEHRGGRAAWLMLSEAVKWGETKGASRIQIGITTGINHDQAERFFGKFGFERTGVLLQRSLPFK